MAGCASSSARGISHVFNEGLCREAQAQAWCKQLACTLTIENAHYLTPLQLLTLDFHRLDFAGGSTKQGTGASAGTPAGEGVRGRV